MEPHSLVSILFVGDDFKYRLDLFRAGERETVLALLLKLDERPAILAAPTMFLQAPLRCTLS
jgi:hypothetical protein